MPPFFPLKNFRLPALAVAGIFSAAVAAAAGIDAFSRLAVAAGGRMESGEFTAGTEWQTFNFSGPQRGRYFCFDALSSLDGKPYAAVAELQLLGEKGVTLDRSGWSVAYVDSEELDRENHGAENLLDGDAATYWHTQWSHDNAPFPHRLILDLGCVTTVTGFRYLPRQGGVEVAGRIKKFQAAVVPDLQAEPPPANLLPEKVFLFSYFVEDDPDGLRLAWSRDGYQWEPLNRGLAFLHPGLPGTSLVRDPCLLRGPDGTFHLVWTRNWTGAGIGYASSRDLLHWDNVRELPVMAGVPGTRNCWAPEIYWDGRRREYLVIWASAVTGRFTGALDRVEAEGNQRIYCTTTKDFNTFTPTKLFYDPDTGAIDPTIFYAAGKYHLVFKDESQHPAMKNLRLAEAADLQGPFGKPGPAISPGGVEGPAVFPAADGFVCLFHYNNRKAWWGALKTVDFKNWTDVSARLLMPPGSHPGTVLQVPRDVLLQLWAAGRAEIGPAPEAADLGLGHWIWTDSVRDKQTCRLWRSFTVPDGVLVSHALLRITADNGYRVFLDGREVGRGGDLNDLTEYDLTQLLAAGTHTLAVEGFNDSLAAGVILGLHLQFLNGKSLDVLSDPSWLVVPAEEPNWMTRKQAGADWQPATIVGFAGKFEWQRPRQILVSPPLLPQEIYFWQRGWFLVFVLAAAAAAVAFSIRQGLKLAVQARSQKLLERERARIASDMHDDLGSGLTQLTLLGEIIMRDTPRDSEPHRRVVELTAKARRLLRTMDEIIWVVNPRRDTVRDFAAFVSEHAQEFLSATEIRCRQEVAAELPDIPLELPQRRNLLLAVKESIRNAARHSGAHEINLKIAVVDNKLTVAVEDDGKGFDIAASPEARNGLKNMRQRLAEIGGSFSVDTAPEKGCRIKFQLPLAAREADNNHTET